MRTASLCRGTIRKLGAILLCKTSGGDTDAGCGHRDRVGVESGAEARSPPTEDGYGPIRPATIRETARGEAA